MAIKMERAIFTVRGISPLLSDNPRQMFEPKGTGRYVELPHAEAAERAVYRDEHGRCCMPTSALRRAIVDVSGSYIVKGRTSLKGYIAHIQVQPEGLTALYDPASNEPLVNYELDIRRAVNPNAGAIVKARPRFDQWQMTFSILFDPTLLTLKDGKKGDEVLAILLEDAGSRIGIGPYRPQKGGWFGRFEVIIL